MLILDRKIGEGLRIGLVTVRVFGIRFHQVRLGFEAPPDVPIYRAELATRLGTVPQEPGRESLRKHRRA